MIDLTPLDVRKKRGDFAKGVRGYNAQEVDAFLELAAERLEELVKENMQLRERADRLAEQVTAQTGRERAVHEALVTAQQLREEIQGTAQREAELVVKEARAQGREIVADAEHKAVERADALHELERRRKRFLASFRQFLERELDAISVEEGRKPVDHDPVIELDLGVSRPVGLDPRPGDDVHALASEAETPSDTDPASDVEESPVESVPDSTRVPEFGTPYGEYVADRQPDSSGPGEAAGDAEPSDPYRSEQDNGRGEPDNDLRML